MMRSVIQTLFLLFLFKNAFCMSLFGINLKYVTDINDVKSEKILRRSFLLDDANDDSNLNKAESAFIRAVKLKDDSSDEQLTVRGFNPTERQHDDLANKETMAALKAAIKFRDEAQEKVNKLMKEIEAERSIKPQTPEGPILTDEQLFNNFFYETLSKYIKKATERNPEPQKPPETELNPLTLIKDQ